MACKRILWLIFDFKYLTHRGVIVFIRVMSGEVSRNTSLVFKIADKKFNAEVYSMYNGWKKIKDYNPDGEDNGQYATPDGMPAWFTVNWRSGYNFTKNITLQISVENILDKNYRYFASGFSAPGRNFIVSLRAGF